MSDEISACGRAGGRAAGGPMAGRYSSRPVCERPAGISHAEKHAGGRTASANIVADYLPHQQLMSA